VYALPQVNFNEMHQARCKGVEAAGSPTSDYELWTPSDGRASMEKCLLGHQVRYTRRRRASQCYNGQEYERVEFRKNCPCAEEDYECDFGYERSTDSGPCVAIMAISSAAPKECSGTYTVSNGYRLVAGDTCDPKTGIDHLPTQYRCPGMFGSSAAEVSSSGWFVLLLLVVMLGALAFVTMNNRSERVRDLLKLSRHIPGLSQFGLGQSGGGGGRYRGLNAAPESAADDELDLGVDEDEAEELHDDVYAYERQQRQPLSSLPGRGPDGGGARMRGAEPSSDAPLLGEEFTSSHTGKKGD
jgi:hypothetical protein